MFIGGPFVLSNVGEGEGYLGGPVLTAGNQLY